MAPLFMEFPFTAPPAKDSTPPEDGTQLLRTAPSAKDDTSKDGTPAKMAPSTKDSTPHEQNDWQTGVKTLPYSQTLFAGVKKTWK